jgi:hypothetical protein
MKMKMRRTRRTRRRMLVKTKRSKREGRKPCSETKRRRATHQTLLIHLIAWPRMVAQGVVGVVSRTLHRKHWKSPT